ncbi:LysR family transcriptional regulator [Streptomyces sp. NRRL S-118]|uniref:LysR family transcriptional regulator n=1 Tax=Streptomyces sp. NRRL S-118 TaxID=1463881 RepID=UPI000586E4D9|nr:LysR family transcriptional regulator [Streptomyces sp. NRRL S-118]
MERHEIETFLTLAEELHFRRTSERLGLAQGRVSQTIKKLERRIGVPLFERTSRHVALTEVGRQLRDDLLPAHRQIQRAVARAVSAGRGITGVLNVGYSSPMAAELVLRAADTFHLQYPDCEVRIREVQLFDPFGPVRGGEVDLQLTERPLDEPDLTAGPVLFAERRVLLVPRGHPLAGHASVSVEDLARTTLVTLCGDIPHYWLDFHYPRRTPAGAPITQGPAATYWPEVLALVGAGKGVSPSCARAERYYARPDVVWVPFRDAPPVEYGLLWPAGGDTARVRAFVETLCAAADERQPAPPGI